MDKQTGKVAAAIDIGSNLVRMRIAQWDGSRVTLLDQLDQPINIGQEVFTSGYLSFETVRRLSSILAGFCAAAREYDVCTIRTIATTAMREAVNRAYVLDHLAIQNRLEVHVLDDMEANALLFDTMKEDGPPAHNVLMVHGGTGTINFALQKDGQAVFTQSLHTGLLKMSEMLRETAEYSPHIDYAAEEFLSTFLSRSGMLESLQEIGGIVFGLGDVRPLFPLCGVEGRPDRAVLSRDRLLAVYEEYRHLSIDQLSARHDLTARQGGALYATLSLLAALLRLTTVQKIHCVRADLTDSLLNLLLRPGARRAYNDSLRAGALACAYELCGRYRCDRVHAAYLSDLALTLYEKLRKVHGLSRRQSLFLQAACILHEVGYYTNTSDMQEASFDLIKDAQLYGLHAHETLLIANIVTPQSLLGVTRTSVRSNQLEEEDVLFVAKMHALLRTADALDFSRRQKAALEGVELRDNRLVLSLRVREDFALEQWMFRQSANLFQEIFGLLPELEINRTDVNMIHG